jgi:sporulation protein YunB
MKFKRRRRWKSAPNKKASRKKVFFLVLVITTFLSLQTFIFIEANLREPLMNIARVRIKQMATQAINTAITERIAQETEVKSLIEWTTDHAGKPTSLVLNHTEHMQIASDTAKVVQNTLDNLQKFPEHIPVGQAFGSAILASFGPEIPVKFVPAGATQINLDIRQKDAGINMVLVEVFIDISVEVSIIIPFDTAPEVVSTEVPITYVLVAGEVPMYYFDNKGHPMDSMNGNGAIPPSISLPMASETEDKGKATSEKASGVPIYP